MNTRLHDAPTRPQTSERASIEEALAAEIRVPMAALRATLENLARRDSSELSRTEVLEASAEEVGRLSRKVCSLVDAALGAPPAESSSRIGELRQQLQGALNPRFQPLVTIASEDDWAAVPVDAPRVAAALAGLVETIGRTGSEVLVRLRYANGLEIRVLAGGEGHEFPIDHKSEGDLRIAFAEHELEAQGMRLQWRTAASGATHIAVRSDDFESFGGAA